MTLDEGDAFLSFAVSLGWLFVLVDVMILGLPSAHKIYLRAMDWLGLELTELLMGFAVFVAGWAAYKFKKKGIKSPTGHWK
jgi:hypothetical protein